jgi:hypothetical protein
MVYCEQLKLVLAHRFIELELTHLNSIHGICS